MIGIVSALALSAALNAHAQSVPAHLVLTANDNSGSAAAVAPRQNVEWDSVAGRWGLKLGVEQHFARNVQLKDLEPGVYYRVTPRLHIGGGVSLAHDQVDNLRLTAPQMPAPRVRLETTFKF